MDECPSTVSTIRSLVPRRFHSTEAFSDGDSSTLTGGPRSAYAGLEPFIRTSITDRIHDGIYETDIGHKSTLGGRVKRGEICCPKMSHYGKRFADDAACQERQQVSQCKGFDQRTSLLLLFGPVALCPPPPPPPPQPFEPKSRS